MATTSSRHESRSIPTLQIDVQGARTHNLKSVDVRLPHDELIVITGPSGCGKSSLAVDTIFAEGQRQFVETLSAYTRQYLDQMPPGDVDYIDGLLPSVKIDQHSASVGPRSTVATITEIYDYLRLLYARSGQVHCHQCGRPVVQQTRQEILDWICRLPEGTKLMVLAPIIRSRKGKHAEVIEQIRTERLVRVRIDGQIFDIDDAPSLDSRKNHSVEAITDRIVVRPGIEDRLLESIDLAVRLTGRLVGVSYQERVDTPIWSEKVFSTEFACPECEINYPEIEPRTFSFNSPHGACTECHGLGRTEQFDRNQLIRDTNKSLMGGAVEVWQPLSKKQISKRLLGLNPVLEFLKLKPDEPLSKLAESGWKVLWEGRSKTTPGLLQLMEKEWATAIDARAFEILKKTRVESRCPFCKGTRLAPTALAVTLNGQNIAELTARSVADARGLIENLMNNLSTATHTASLLKEISHRLKFLEHVGLGYITLDRGGQTLSGGELQRVRLSAAIGSGLTNVCFVLDEPSIGLHSRDTNHLIEAIKSLRDAGNTVLVVEHDEAIMRAADRLIDMGPGAGQRGGTIVAAGRPEDVIQDPNSLTGNYLSGRKRIPVPARKTDSPIGTLRLRGARGHNLKNIDVEFPIGRLTAVTGVSGSGKSTLVNRTLAPALFNHFNDFKRPAEPFDGLEGANLLEKFVEVDQSPIGRNSRSCPATYTGVFEEIRKVFAATRAAKQLGFSASRFSYNNALGRCTECLGLGEKTLKMNFLPDMSVPCGTCDGLRYNEQTLFVRYRDLTIADVLRLPISQVAIEFQEHFKIKDVLQTLIDVGLGYLSLGQSASSLSGGEAQRVKLATELSTREFGRTLYLLDEPTTGLHFEDVRRLIELLVRLVEKGNTIIVIEHHLDVIKSADWIIDLGPEGGSAGGEIVAMGTPESVASTKNSYTGMFLKEAINRRHD